MPPSLEPIDPARTYRVAVNNFLLQGGDGFTAFKEGRFVAGGGNDLDALEARLSADGAEAAVAPAVESAPGLAVGTQAPAFTLPALAPVAYNAAIIFGIIALAPSMGIEGVAIGAVVAQIDTASGVVPVT